MENVATSDSVRAIAIPKSLWESSRSSGPSCYGSLNASTSSACASGIVRSSSVSSNTPAYEKLPKSDSADFVDAPKFHYDMDFDLRALKAALKSAEFLEESGYQSVLERSQHNLYGTGWLINENMSNDGSEDVDDNWDGFMDVGDQRVKIKEMSDILASRFAFISDPQEPEACGSRIRRPPSTDEVSEAVEFNVLLTY